MERVANIWNISRLKRMSFNFLFFLLFYSWFSSFEKSVSFHFQFWECSIFSLSTFFAPSHTPWTPHTTSSSSSLRRPRARAGFLHGHLILYAPCTLAFTFSIPKPKVKEAKRGSVA